MDNKDNNELLNEYIKEEQIMNKKTNTFNLVIGLATLIIAILGATFAYFTMTNGSAENEIAVKSSYVSIAYEGGTKVEADDLIPTSENVMLWAYQDRLTETYQDEEGNEHTFQCIDSKNRKVCYVYQFTVRSDGEGESTNILGTITVNQNEFVEEFKNENDEVIETKSGLSYMVFELTDNGNGTTTYRKVSASEVASIHPKDVEKYGADNELYKFTRFGLPTQEIAEDGTVTTHSVDNYLFGTDGHIDISNGVDHVYQIVIWLHDDDYDQNREQAKNFAGSIRVNVKSGDNAGNITGTREDETDVPSEDRTDTPVEEEPEIPTE